MKMKIAILTIAAVLSVGCANNPDLAADSASIPYAGGDVCEWAKKNLVVATQQFHRYQNETYYDLGADLAPGKSAWQPTKRAIAAANNLRVAQANIATSCADSGKGGAWACAEGHSCK